MQGLYDGDAVSIPATSAHPSRYPSGYFSGPDGYTPEPMRGAGPSRAGPPTYFTMGPERGGNAAAALEMMKASGLLLRPGAGRGA